MKKKEFRAKLRVLGFVLLLLYLGVLAYVVFFSKEFGREGTTNMQYNLIPFRTITNFYYYSTFQGKMINIGGNILAFMPFGLILPIVFKKEQHKVYIHLVCFWSFLLSLFIEIIQILSSVGAFDVDDLILNTVGGIVGYLIYLILKTNFNGALKRRRN